MRERPVSSVPRAVLALLGVGLLLQLAAHFAHPPVAQDGALLLPPPSEASARLASLGDPLAMARLVTLNLQSVDHGPSARRLDGRQLSAWLDLPLALDPRGQYPLLLASRVYGEQPDPARQRQMLDFVYRHFQEDPDRRWPWLAHAAFVARHRLGDMELARRYAQAIRERATGPGVPQWARQMEIFILEDMNELDRARILLGGLLENGVISDPHEKRFLAARLAEMERKASAKP